jgi:hypothetical protein
MGSIAGDDKNSSDPFNQQRGKNFSTTINELSLTAEYNFFNYQYHRYHKDWSPYVFGGVGFMKFSQEITLRLTTNKIRLSYLLVWVSNTTLKDLGI